METYQMTDAQRTKWTNAYGYIGDLVSTVNKVVSGTQAIVRTCEWFRQRTGAYPPSYSQYADVIAKLKVNSPKLLRQAQALTYSYNLVKDGKAGVQESAKFPGDFDIITNVLPVPDEINAHIYDRNLGMAWIIPFIPLLVKAGTVIVTAVLVYGCVDAVTETVNKSIESQNDVQRTQAAIQKDILKDPDLAKDFVKNFKPSLPTGSWFDQIKQAGGSMISFALIALAGFLLFKLLDRGKN